MASPKRPRRPKRILLTLEVRTPLTTRILRSSRRYALRVDGRAVQVLEAEANAIV